MTIVRVLSSNIILQFHHRVKIYIYTGDSHSPSLIYQNTSVLANISSTNPRASHEATPSGASALRWPIRRLPLSTWRLLQSHRPTFPHGNQSGTWHSVQVRSDAKSHIITNAIMNHKTCVCYIYIIHYHRAIVTQVNTYRSLPLPQLFPRDNGPEDTDNWSQL